MIAATFFIFLIYEQFNLHNRLLRIFYTITLLDFGEYLIDKVFYYNKQL